MKKFYFAVDLGATSGRTMLGIVGDDSVQLEEVNRFPNKIIEVNGHFYWDILALYQNILDGLKIVAGRKIEIASIGIDTWGVDFVCIDPNGEIAANPYSYRDPHTNNAQELFFQSVPKQEVYNSTGIQFMNFNSVFQLAAMKEAGSFALSSASKILFMPDALSYLLTGNAVAEYTIASTSQMLDARKRKFDPVILDALDLDESHFGDLVFPGTVIGTLTPEVQAQTGLGAVPVVAVAGHDTGAAVAAVPSPDQNFAYLSSGTWSLMGIEAEQPIINEDSFAYNFTNEGGVDGTIRFLKNICGMWLLERCRAEWGTEAEVNDYPTLIADAMAAPAFVSFINPDDPSFANPVSMVKSIQDYCSKTGQPVPESKAAITRCIFESLALRYRQVFDILRHFADFEINKLHVIGGGSQNKMLNQFTANALGVSVVAGPVEATAIGNVMVQAKAGGLYKDVQEMRDNLCNSIKLDSYQPENEAAWAEAYERFAGVVL
jgi:rhamnulokinase